MINADYRRKLDAHYESLAVDCPDLDLINRNLAGWAPQAIEDLLTQHSPQIDPLNTGYDEDLRKAGPR